jgi:uncharacterized protein with ParB-like and HNH nuclease domain
MKASETTLRNLLEGTKQFQIPLFQRPYSWKKDNWETLWQDLMSLYNDEVKGSYFLGPIVTQAGSGTADGISPFIVIDGQQRLSTLTIILAALRNYLKKTDRDMAQEVEELYLINKFKKNDDIYKVLPTQDDREVYKSIIQSKQTKDIKKEGQIYEAYKFFDGKFKKPDLEDDLSLDYIKFKTIMLESIVLVNITSDEADNPYLIFESLNNKGEELSQADLVRNYIFMKLPAEEQENIYKSTWLPLQESFRKNILPNKEYADELTNAFWFYLRKDGAAVSEKAVYQTLKKHIETSDKNIKHELDTLIQFSNYYQRLKFFHEEPEAKLQRWFERLMRLDFTTCHIFLLNIYHEYEEGKISLEDFETILKYLESYFVRRWLTGVSTRVLGNVFNNLYKQVKGKRPDDVVCGLHEVLTGFEGSQIWPNNDSFRQAIINEHLYKSSGTNDRVKLLLESIEEYLTKERVGFDNISIEHIMPQKSPLRKEWQQMLGASYGNIHKKWLHTLGNLTLTGYNPELSNKPFEEKLLVFKSSNLTLNQYFRDIEIWNEEAIKNRAEYLADMATKIWPR